MEIIPLIIADFISDERNLYLILDHSDDFRKNLSSMFDVEILYKLGENCIEEVLNQRADKISDLKNNRKKVENNIENYEKILQENEKDKIITYIIITLQKLKYFLNWLNTKIYILENDNIIFKEYERNMKEKEKMNNIDINSRNHGRINNNGGKSKRQVIVDNYQQLKRDFEMRKFILKKRKILNSNNKLNKIILKPINKNHSNEMNNSNNNSKNNISNIENDNSNNNIDSGEISDEYNNSFMLSERKMTKKKPKFYYPKIKKVNFNNNNYDDIMTEKKVNYEDENNDIDNSKSSNNKEINNNLNINIKKSNLKQFKKYIIYTYKKKLESNIREKIKTTKDSKYNLKSAFDNNIITN